MTAVVARTLIVVGSRAAIHFGVAHKLVVTRLRTLGLETCEFVDNIVGNTQIGVERRGVALIRNNLLPQPLWSIHLHKRLYIDIAGGRTTFNTLEAQLLRMSYKPPHSHDNRHNNHGSSHLTRGAVSFLILLLCHIDIDDRAKLRQINVSGKSINPLHLPRKSHKKLYLIPFLHQTTTDKEASASHYCCILFHFYIKPQRCSILSLRASGCILFHFYIKPQPILSLRASDAGCILFHFYIKPQLLSVSPHPH